MNRMLIELMSGPNRDAPCSAIRSGEVNTAIVRCPSLSSICHGKYLSRGREPGGIEIGTGRITRASNSVDRNESVLLLSAAANRFDSVSFAGAKPTAQASFGATISASWIFACRGVHDGEAAVVGCP